jgi:hypothetical protein
MYSRNVDSHPFRRNVGTQYVQFTAKVMPIFSVNLVIFIITILNF